MESIKNPYQLQLFICTNLKAKGECCANKGAAALRDELKQICKEKYGKDVRVNAAGCMGGCENGIMAAIYPQNKWFSKVTTNDKDLLLKAVSETLGVKE